MQNYVGIIKQSGRDALLILDRPDQLVGRELFIPSRYLHGAPFGMKAVARLTAEPGPDGLGATGEITEVLGDPGRPDIAILGIIRQHGLSEKFPARVLSEAEKYGVNPEPESIEEEIRRGRRDLRDLRTITIDGEDARDLDDAVNIEKTENGYLLGVHIADVTYYVQENSVLDREARERGTSVYLSDRVLPMLPPRLSNGICSLNPDVDRLTLSAIMEFDNDGRQVGGEICESIIRSKARTSYKEVKKSLETGEVLPDRYPQFLEDLRNMRELSDKMSELRRERGSIDFEFPETHVDLDENGKPTAIYAYPISFANGIIESFMIAANEFVALTATAEKLPFSYRVHELPDPEKLDKFIKLANVFGVQMKLRGKPTPAMLAAALNKVKQEPFGLTLSQLLLRSLAKARYAPDNLGHFGLASTNYCHFTSPIRRYPDLFVHRVLKGWLHSDVPKSRWNKLADSISEHSSDMERSAMQAERDSVDQKAAEYLSEHLGMTFTGVISGFNPAGFFVQLENTVEGMVPFRSLDGYYDFIEERLCAVNYSSGTQLHIGDPVEVQVAQVDVIRRRIDFEMIKHEAAQGSHVSSMADKIRSGRRGKPDSRRKPKSTVPYVGSRSGKKNKFKSAGSAKSKKSGKTKPRRKKK
ncbi:MAG: ribonuclease [Clostridiales bacterium]|jgi:ribonuclease R|nr:ribonuclease [Clostridiales bacterium]